jgi:CDP-diacylglycerol--glycerol-3-phosphate 3-phosphatidyltransferase
MGKNKMVSQTIAIIFLLVSIPGIQFLLDTFGLFFLWVSLILGYWSAHDYFMAFYEQIRQQEKQNQLR